MRRVTMTCLLLALSGSLAQAVEPPSPPPHGRTKQQKDWLRDHLAAEMRTINTFPTNAFDEMRQKVGSTTPDETDLLTDCYQLTRRIAERELRQIAQALIAQAQAGQAQGGQPQAVQTAAPPQEDEQVKADREDLRKLYKKLAEARKPARTVSEYIYASLPGWCAQIAQYVPPSYYGNGQYVGPLDSEVYAGHYARYVYMAYLHKNSYFNKQIRDVMRFAVVPLGTNPNPVVPQGNGPGQNRPAPRGANPHMVELPFRPVPVTTPCNTAWQGGGFQGSGATQSSRGR